MECRKTKYKVNYLTIKTDTNNRNDQSEVDANTSDWRHAQENACGQVTIGFGFSSNCLRKFPLTPN